MAAPKKYENIFILDGIDGLEAYATQKLAFDAINKYFNGEIERALFYHSILFKSAFLKTGYGGIEIRVIKLKLNKY